MFKFKHQKPGTAPATLVAPDSESLLKPVIILMEYDQANFTEKKVENIEELYPCRDNEKVSWINIDGLGDVELLRRIGEHFGLHPLALEDVLNTSHRPKIEEYHEHYFIIAQMIYPNESKEVCCEQVSMFLGANFLITIQEDVGDVFDTVRARIRNGRGFARSMKADYLAYALIDAVVDHFFPALEMLGDEIEDLETELLDHPSRQCVMRLHDLKRTLLHLRRAAWPEREIVNALSRDESGLVCKETKLFLRDCYDHLIQIMDVIESYRDLTTGMMDLYLSSLGIRTNEIMRVLTVVTTIFIPLTFIAGVYGMNFSPEAGRFSMPELRQPYGYPACLALMLAVAVGMIFFFRKKRWL